MCRCLLRNERAPDEDGIEIVANREGLQDVAEVCSALSRLSTEEGRTAANHYHFADHVNSAQDGSLLLKFDFGLISEAPICAHVEETC